MDYKGFEYSVVQTANPTGWKWVVRLDEMRTKVGTAYSRASAVRFAELAIQKHLKRSGGRGLPSPVRATSE
jgi:predicted RNase H-like HicB family nuclease